MRVYADVPGKVRVIGVKLLFFCEGSAFQKGIALLLISSSADFTTARMMQI